MSEWKLDLKLGGVLTDETCVLRGHARLRGTFRDIEVRIELPYEPEATLKQTRYAVAAAVKKALHDALDEIPFDDPEAIEALDIETGKAPSF